jgi:hypothetical protein
LNWILLSKDFLSLSLLLVIFWRIRYITSDAVGWVDDAESMINDVDDIGI